jgi:uncharacterized repeat protein (TIGR03843 family)
VYGVDHGVSFSVEPKLRTLLWQWAGQPLPEAEIDRLTQLYQALRGPLGERLHELLTTREVRRTVRRVELLLRNAIHPEPSGDWPALPWPPV